MSRSSRAGRRRSAVRRAWLYCLLLALPALIFVAVFLYQQGSLPGAGASARSAACCFTSLLVAAALVEGLIRPLQTLSNVVSSLREGDYSFRARGAGTHDAFGELAGEVNALADLLQKQRVRSLEATALLARILEVMHAPLFAFDREESAATGEQRRRQAARPYRMRAASAAPRASWASKTCSPRPIRPSTPSAPSPRAGCCARPPSARMACPTRCCCWPT